MRRALPAARGGDETARAEVAAALLRLVEEAPDDTARFTLQLEAALLLEAAGDRTHALPHFRAALTLEPRSAVAATGTARLAPAAGDVEAQVAGAAAKGELTADAKARARFFVEAAALLLRASDARLGTADERHARVVELLERALVADPESISAAGVLVTVLKADGDHDRLVSDLGAALASATTKEAILLLGTELARTTRTRKEGLLRAISAMEKVRAVAPNHTPSLLLLAELYAEQGALREAATLLEEVATPPRSAASRLTALFELARLYGVGLLGEPTSAARVLRVALAIDPKNARALEALAALLRDLPDAEKERAGLLERLAVVTDAPDAKSRVLQTLAEVRAAMGETAAATQALIEATAEKPTAELLVKVAQACGSDAGAYARALSAIVLRSEALGRPSAEALVALARAELGPSARPADAVLHLRAALALAPAAHEARFLLATALVRVGANAEAAQALLALVQGAPPPLLSLPEPGEALLLLERALDAQGRHDGSMSVRELRAIAGSLSDSGKAELRARRPRAPRALPRETLIRGVISDAGALLLDLARAAEGVEVKVLGRGLEEMGVASRERLDPHDAHPLRGVLDRALVMFGLSSAELVVSQAVQTTRLVFLELPWVILAARARGSEGAGAGGGRGASAHPGEPRSPLAPRPHAGRRPALLPRARAAGRAGRRRDGRRRGARSAPRARALAKAEEGARGARTTGPRHALPDPRRRRSSGGGGASRRGAGGATGHGRSLVGPR